MDVKRYASGAVVVGIGFATGLIPVFDITQDAVVQGNSFTSTFIENAPLLVMSLFVTAIGIWLVVSDWETPYVQTTATLTLAQSVGVALLMSLVVLVQLRLQNNLKPLVIAADAVIIAAVGGLLLGLRTAQQERATDEAATQRDRFQALFENVPNPIVGVEFVDDAPIVRAVNPAFTEVFGFDRHTIVGENLEQYIVPPEESLDPVGQAMTTEEVAAADSWDKHVIDLETVDGRREFIRLTAPVERGPERDSYGIYIDVTVQRQRRERLRVLSRALRHDIRNQLSIIKPSAEYLADELEGKPGAQSTTIVDAADEIHQLSEQTRQIERQIANETDPTTWDLVTLVENAAATVRSKYDAEILVETPDQAYGHTMESFQTACAEVIENGIVHSDKAEPTVEVSIVESLDEGYYGVQIADDGPGIPEDQRDVITGKTRATQTKHLDGLGLWTARWVVQNSGGTIDVTANAPRGTVVTLKIPQAAAPGDPDKTATAGVPE